MKTISPGLTSIAILTLGLLSGCRSTKEALYHAERQFYSGSSQITSRSWNGFLVKCPAPWGLIGEAHLDGSPTETGMMIGVSDYEWSPVVQFNKLGTSVMWSEDLARVDEELSRLQELEHVQTSESLVSYCGFAGHGLRKVGISRGRRSEFIIFYPEGLLAGVRFVVLLYGDPNAVSLRELDGVLRSVTYNPDTPKCIP